MLIKADTWEEDFIMNIEVDEVVKGVNGEGWSRYVTDDVECVFDVLIDLKLSVVVF